MGNDAFMALRSSKRTLQLAAMDAMCARSVGSGKSAEKKHSRTTRRSS